MFNIEKLIQTCNYLLKKNNNSLNYTKLIKLLYIADKESLKQSLQTITGDSYVSMDNGPVLSKLYNLIKRQHRNESYQNLWNSRFIRDGYDLTAVTHQIPQGELSKFEINILDNVYEQYKDTDVREIIKILHKCPEWKHPSGSSIPIKPKEILESIGKSSEEIDWILAETQAFEEEDRVFVSLASE